MSLASCLTPRGCKPPARSGRAGAPPSPSVGQDDGGTTRVGEAGACLLGGEGGEPLVPHQDRQAEHVSCQLSDCSRLQASGKIGPSRRAARVRVSAKTTAGRQESVKPVRVSCRMSDCSRLQASGKTWPSRRDSGRAPALLPPPASDSHPFGRMTRGSAADLVTSPEGGQTAGQGKADPRQGADYAPVAIWPAGVDRTAGARGC
jgi:hypothetical protein